MLLFLSSVLAVLLCRVDSYGIDNRLEINLLDSLALNNTVRGVTQVPGFHNRSPAYLIQGGSRYLQLPYFAFKKAETLLKTGNEFTILATIKQDARNSGSILSVSAGRTNSSERREPGKLTNKLLLNFHRFLELYTSTRRSQLKFFYTGADKLYAEEFSYPLVPDKWTKIAFTVSGTHITLYIDCNKVTERVIHKPNLNIDQNDLVMWMGQRNDQAFFKGTVQDVKLIVTSHGYLSQCPELERQCPTCGEYLQMIGTIDNLSNLLQEMETRLNDAEQRISELSECRCQKSCEHNDVVKSDMETWIEDCQQCTCNQGAVECSAMDCPQVSCKYPVVPEGQCCPVCRRQCFFGGQFFDDGESFSPRQCAICQCENGRTSCNHQNPNEICPKLTCPLDQQFNVPDECCKFCQGVDYCNEGHDCHANATCVSLSTKHACQCLSGFEGNGKDCVDIDECKDEGGLYGHHCHDNTICVNTPGSYLCECLPGHVRDDDFTCSAVCSPLCINSGRCVAPDICWCPAGYVGSYCQTDVDECASNNHGCHSNSVCINLPGSYYCQCKTGYYSESDPHLDLGASCIDADECRNIGGSHTCQLDMVCVNEEGGYQCQCNNMDSCSSRCLYQGYEYRNGQRFNHPDNECYDCRCENGVTACTPEVCNCDSDSVNLFCCPHCDFKGQCLHQSSPVVYDSGDSWDYQCQRCQCINGRIECTEKRCPKLNCETTVSTVGECCPICLEDICSIAISDDIIRSGDDISINCVQNGIEYYEGERWEMNDDSCSECICR
uniref:Protein kinase C-binding protein NELL1-like n=1 Tax=Saccoglossus kowalevskii TaxID=10224 RepID=A0ABM0MNC7_SACKO